jgi:hypothetical protein
MHHVYLFLRRLRVDSEIIHGSCKAHLLDAAIALMLSLYEVTQIGAI